MASWFAVYVQARHEKTVSAILNTKGYDTCLPLVRVRRDWCDRTKYLDLPAFPGYVFCQLDPAWRTPVLATPGVVALVGSGKVPIAITHDEVNSLMTMQRAKCIGESYPFLRTGQRVRIEGGVLDGLTGILSDCRNSTKVVVSVGLLQRSVALEVSRARAIPIGDDSRVSSRAGLIRRLPVIEEKTLVARAAAAH